MHELNYDHVVPRVQGGKTVWENIVTACSGSHACNAMKGGRTPAQAGMKLLKKPTKPKTLPLTQPLIGLTHVPELWRAYLST